MAKQIRFDIKLNVDGKEVVGSAVSDVKEMRRAWDNASSAAKKFQDVMFRFNQITQGLHTITSLMSDLSGSFRTQLEVERQLEQVMHNNTAATDEQINSIKDLCGEQQRLGIIGDEVQLAGAKNLAMHVKETSTLKQLIPVMNDLAVQQAGYNVTASDTERIANMLGKALDGNANALKRAGIVLDEGQEQVLKYGDEWSRTSVIVAAIKEKVGGLNEEMAKTDAGQAIQMSNSFGDFKEKIGEVFSSIQPFIEKIASIGFATTGIITLANGFKVLYTAIKSTGVVQGFLNVTNTWATGIMTAFGIATTGASIAVKALRFAIRALLISTGVGILIVGVTELLNAFINSADEAGDSAEGMAEKMKSASDIINEANQNMANHQAQTFGQLMGSFSALQAEWNNLREKGEKLEWIKNHQAEMENLGLKVNDVTTAEDVFKKNTAAVVKAFKLRAEAAAYQAKLTELYNQKIALTDEYSREQSTWQSNRRKSLEDQYERAKMKRPHAITKDQAVKYGLIEGEDYTLDRGSMNGVMTATESGMQKYNSGLYKEIMSQGVGTNPFYELKYRTGMLSLATEIQKTTEHLTDVTNRANNAFSALSGGYSTAHIKPTPVTTPSHASESQNASRSHTNTSDKPDMTGKYYQNPTTRDELSHNIDVASAKAQSAKTDAELNGLREKINSWQNKIDQMDLQELSAQRPNISELNSERPGVSGYQSLDEVRREMAYWQKFLEVAKTEGQRDTARANLKGLEEVQRSMMKTLPKYTNTLAEIAEAEQYWNDVRENGDEITIKMADNALEELGKKKRILENTSIAAFDSADIKTYDELTRKLQYYEEELQHATSGAARKQIQDHIDDLNKVKDAWDEQLVVVEKDITKLRTVKDLSEDISKIQQKQQKLTNADDWEEYARMIDARSKKQKGLERGQVIIDNENELSELFKLSGKELRLEVKAMGIDGINSKIRELQKMLDDTDNPLTEKQSSEVQHLIEQYEDLRKVCVQSFDTYREGWSAVQNIGDGIQSMTDALEGHKNVWERITGTVNAALQIYDGITKIVEFINLLTSVTKAQTAAEAAKTVATTASTTAQGIEAAAEETNAAAAVPAVVANKALAASFTELASAAYFAAHASIPFAGFGIAAGFSTAAAAMVQAIGMMTFAQGGIVGGSSIVGDNLLARVNSGEMILNTLQQRRLFNLLDGNTPYSSLNPAGARMVPTSSLSALRHNLNNGGNISLEVQGRKLVGVLANETRISGKSGRRTNIRI